MLIFNLKARNMHTSGHHCCGLGRGGTGEVSLKRILPIKYEPGLVSVRGRVWNEKDLWPLPTFPSRQKRSNGFL